MLRECRLRGQDFIQFPNSILGSLGFSSSLEITLNSNQNLRTHMFQGFRPFITWSQAISCSTSQCSCAVSPQSAKPCIMHADMCQGQNAEPPQRFSFNANDTIYMNFSLSPLQLLIASLWMLAQALSSNLHDEVQLCADSYGASTCSQW